MSQDIIHLYLMPGMAANPTIFEHIKLPESQFKILWLDWLIPEPNEHIKAYAQRMNARITESNAALLGVSFGGILVQEMSKLRDFKTVIVVSSVKSKHELPKRMKLVKLTKAYKILPTQLVKNIDYLAKYAFGETITKRLELYKKYLSVTNKRYLDWAIKEVVCWEQNEPLKGVIYIHGDKDPVFPHSCTEDTLVVKGGTHIMIINKYKWFNENLPSLLVN
ncbi:alpha/beta hydrolase [Ichthyenterobacterium sp. W332]|uniref:Alpha/beta hydrolase n=1 Tax=Microcosmobacter mediterraneus TaxID=3075607 RepID=A0ABU2YJU1_9FLAO|nr:alpha/beta hydrolase [Ichthyenterobacterium sp. W332]MDT0557323.1 alpha/beta hydrolase [Ichthyenterobacterium sp. W332]